jgi:hypothetical protein
VIPVVVGSNPISHPNFRKSPILLGVESDEPTRTRGALTESDGFTETSGVREGTTRIAGRASASPSDHGLTIR